MEDSYFGTKELYHVVLRAKTRFAFGDRIIEAGEPVLYFDNITLSSTREGSNPVMARGGYHNRPLIIWEDRSDVTFSLSDGVINKIGMGILFGAKVLKKASTDATFIPYVEEPFELDNNKQFNTTYLASTAKPYFCYEYANDTIQKKVECTLLGTKLTVPSGELTKTYVLDYYYIYGDEALVYTISSDRFNGLFSLEGFFYTKDDTSGTQITNILTLPRVKIISNINLRLGERVDPLASSFNMIAMPERNATGVDTIMEISHLNTDLEGDI